MHSSFRAAGVNDHLQLLERTYLPPGYRLYPPLANRGRDYLLTVSPPDFGVLK